MDGTILEAVPTANPLPPPVLRVSEVAPMRPAESGASAQPSGVPVSSIPSEPALPSARARLRLVDRLSALQERVAEPRPSGSTPPALRVTEAAMPWIDLDRRNPATGHSTADDAGDPAGYSQPPPLQPRLAALITARQLVEDTGALALDLPAETGIAPEAGEAFGEFRSPAEIIGAIAAATASDPGFALHIADAVPLPPPLPGDATAEDETAHDETAHDLTELLAETRSAAEAAFADPAAAAGAVEDNDRPPMIIERAQVAQTAGRIEAAGRHSADRLPAWPGFSAGLAVAVVAGVALYFWLPSPA